MSALSRPTFGSHRQTKYRGDFGELSKAVPVRAPRQQRLQFKLILNCGRNNLRPFPATAFHEFTLRKQASDRQH